MDRPTICLNLIEKDEAHIIEETLESIYRYIDYYVISDTGSTDNTKEVITDFFNKKGIKGKIYDDPWQNHFGVNRTLALQRCNEPDVDVKIDYIWVIDADDIIVGDLVLPKVMDADAYSLRYGNEFTYHRTQIFKNDPNLNWRYECVRHEYPTCDKPNANIVYIEGDYYIDSRRKGARSNDPKKYLNDALAFEDWIIKEPHHKHRYMFYMAQSYFDHGDIENAIDRYKKRIDMGGWYEETFYSYYKIAEGLQKLGKPWEEIEKVYIEAYNFCKIRAEPLYQIAYHYANSDDENDYKTAYKYAKAAANIPYPKQCKLFIFKDIYDYKAPELLARMAYYMGEYAESYYTYKKLLDSDDIPDHFRPNIQKNIQFPLDQLTNNINCCLLYTGHRIIPYNDTIKDLLKVITEHHTLYIIGDNVDYRYSELENIIYTQEDELFKKDKIEFTKVFILDDLTYYTSKLHNRLSDHKVVHINTTDSFKIYSSTKYVTEIDNINILCDYLKYVDNMFFFKCDNYEYNDFVSRYKLQNITDITDNNGSLFESRSTIIKINLTDICNIEYNGMVLKLPYYIKKILGNNVISEYNNNILKNFLVGYKSTMSKYPSPFHYLANYYEKMKDYNSALQYIDNALKLVRNNRLYDDYIQILNVDRGKYLHLLGYHQKSYNACNKAILSEKLPDLYYAYAENWRDRNIEHIKDKTLGYPSREIANIMKSQKGNIGDNFDYPIVFSMTTCKRYDLFVKTINSFLNCCKDYSKIDRWILVDDNSSKKDRKLMKERYPFFEFIFKEPDQKGHYKSMNIIHDYIIKHNTKYLIHSEDDFHYVEKREYVTDAIKIFEYEEEKLGQVLFNRNYAEVELYKRPIPGGFKKNVKDAHVRYVIHEHYDPGSWEYTNFINKFEGYGTNCYWPHFSFRPSMLRCDMLKDLGIFCNSPHFELQFAKEYKKEGYKSAFFDSFCCIHTGKKTWEQDGVNSYKLNKTDQFTINNSKLDIKILKNNDKDVWKSFKKEANLNLPYFNIIQDEIKDLDDDMKRLFLNNNFQYRRDILNNIGNQINIIKSFESEFCLIMNDHITFSDNFTNSLKDIINVTPLSTHITKFDDNYNIYLLSREGADIIKDKLSELENVNSIEDIFNSCNLTVVSGDLPIRSADVRYSEPVELEGYKFYCHMDSHGNDISYVDNKTVKELKETADNMKNCVAFNTLGWFKHTVLEEKDFKYLHLSKRLEDGIYIKVTT